MGKEMEREKNINILFLKISPNLNLKENFLMEKNDVEADIIMKKKLYIPLKMEKVLSKNIIIIIK